MARLVVRQEKSAPHKTRERHVVMLHDFLCACDGPVRRVDSCGGNIGENSFGLGANDEYGVGHVGAFLKRMMIVGRK